jgi:23S rRNA pseudouridine1911/1915/1917 synthase
MGRRKGFCLFMLLCETDEQEWLTGVFGEEEAGLRLDAALAHLFPELSRNRVQALIAAGDVWCDETVVTSKKSPAHAGEVVRILLSLRVPVDVLPEEIPINIVYEDASLLIVNKPRGMVVHPAPGNEHHTLVNGLLWHIGQGGGLSSINGELRPGIVHRIDKNTSGLLVVAKCDAAHRALSAQFASHRITRKYIALVAGGFRTDEGTVDGPLGRDPKDRKRQKVLPEGQGRKAVTHYRVLERLSACSLLEVQLETGRTHQIRAHMAHIGHPLLGDDLYGPAPKRGQERAAGQILHAKTLGFCHPDTGREMVFDSPLPAYFREALVSHKSSYYG